MQLITDGDDDDDDDDSVWVMLPREPKASEYWAGSLLVIDSTACT